MRKNAFLSFILALVMLLISILPAGPIAYAAGNSTTIDVTDTSNMPASVTYNNGIFTINDNTVSTITVTGTTTTNTIAVANGVTGLTLILNNLNITNPVSSISPINLQSNTGVTIQLANGTVNTLNASTMDTMAGLCVPITATVTINGTGSLTATGGKWGAGIGGGSGATGGTINISSGTVIATGGYRGAGIGGGNTCPGGTVSISGGTVTATGGQSAAGIGGGITGAGGTVSISGGTVTAVGGQGGAGIGGGGFGASGVINITGTPVVMAASDSSRPAIHAASGSGNVINATLNNAISANPTYLKCNGNELTFPGNYKNFAFSAASASAVSAYSDQTYTTLLGSIMTNPAGVVNIPVTNLSTNPSDVTPVMINIATITVKKDGSAWTSGTPTIQLSTSSTALQGVVTGTCSNGVYTFTGIDPATTYYVWDATSYTNQSVSITGLNNATVNYYTVQFAVTNAGTASGSTIAATYNSSAISAGDIVLGGKQLVITSVGQGASSYSYAWSGTGTSGQTTAALTIATLSSSVNATCTVTGAPASTTINVGDSSGSNLPTGVTYASNLFAIGTGANNSTITVTGTTTANTIAVANGVTGLSLILNGVSITTSQLSGNSPIDLQGNANVTIQLANGTVNTLDVSGGSGKAGIHAGNGAVLSINGTGSLTAKGDSGSGAAGIGGNGSGAGEDGGTITISGGTVNATGGYVGAGIGGGGNTGLSHGAGGTITISGGTVTAQGGYFSAGIGGCNAYGSGGTITISGGTVNATGGRSGAGIGGGAGGSGTAGGTISISNSANVTAIGGVNGGAGIGGGNQGGNGTITISGSSTVIAASDGKDKPAINAEVTGNSGSVINAALNAPIGSASYLKCNGNILSFPSNYKNFAFSAATASVVGVYSNLLCTAFLGSIVQVSDNSPSISATNLSVNPANVTAVKLLTATVTVNKDSTPWITGTLEIQLSTLNTTLTGAISGTCTNGVYTFTGLDPATTYYVWDTTNNQYTGQSVTSTSASATLNYYSVNFAVADAGAASGSTIAATYNSSAISAGDVVLGGKQLVITAAGAGAGSYTYAWSGTGTSGETTAGLTIPNLSSSVNATCTVTGIPASTTINVGDSSGTNLPTGVTYASNLFTIGTGANNSTITVTGTTTANTISVAPGVSNLTLILSDVSITSTVVSPMNLQGNANVMIQLADSSTNTLNASGANTKPGLCVPSTATVTINGTTGTLVATGGSYGAGIGGDNSDAGIININGGTVTATSSGWGAGIGGGNVGTGGNITINGGTVNATGGQYSAGIGGGYMGTSGGNIIINGGTVNATGGQAAAGIGGGGGGAGGNITINAGTVKATGNFTGAGIGGGDSGAGGTLTISGSANVTAIGGTTTGGLHGGAGIGGGYLGSGGTINISGTPIIMAAAENNKPAIDVVSASGNSVINAQLNNANGPSAKYLKCNGNVLKFPGYYKSFAFSSAADSVVNAYTDLSCTNFSGSIVTNPGNVASIPLTSPTVATPVMFYTIIVTVNKDGVAWSSGSPTLKLSTSSAICQNTKGATPLNGVYTFTGLDSATTYYVWDQTNNIYTNQSILCPSASATLDYYTVNFAVADAGTASGSTIAATYNSSAISAGDVVLGGKQLVITAAGAGAGSYMYAWSGVGTNGETTAAMTIANLSSSVNATCTVTGIPATYTATINLKKDGSAWTSSSKIITIQQASETPTATIEAGGVFTANVVNGTWKILADGTDTGATVVINNAAATQNLNYYTVNFAAADAGAASGSTVAATYNSAAISTGDVVLGGKQLVITATGAGAGSYTYAWSGAGTSGETTAALTIANLSSSVNATCTVTGIPATYTATVNLKKDGSAWTGSGKTITLQQASEIPTVTMEANGVFTANVVNGTWKILADGVDTGATVVINNAAATQNLNYYTVNFAAADAGAASGSTVAATYNSSAISAGDVVLGGKQLVITAAGAGASSYMYAWSGVGTNGETTAAMTIANLSSSVNATCTVTGIPATYTATINLKKDGSAWTSSSKIITIQQASETPTATIEAGGVFTANVVNGTWKILADGTDTGSTVVINNGAASQDLNYYTVQFAVMNGGTASGSTIAATYNSSPISAGDIVLGGKQLVITAAGVGAGSYTYAWSGACTNGETTAVLTIANLSSSVNATCTVTGIPATYTATVNLKKDGSAWTSSGKTITLQQASEAPTATTEVGGVFKTNVVNGTWKILADGVDTGATVVINNSAAPQNLNYYTVNFSAADADAASGSTIAATYNSSAISAGDVVLGGKQLVITAAGAGAGSYTYAWSGAGTNGETTALLTIANLSSSVNATCTVTGIPATYTATVNLKKDGSAWTSPGKTITLQQASEAPTSTTEAGGVFTANVVNGTWKVLVNGTDTGSTVVINNWAASQDINYYTVNFSAADTGAASGSTIAATYNSSAISSGDVVLGGKQLVITAAGAGAGSYTYAWSGAGTNGETTALLTIANLSSSVNATCTVTGIPASYTATVNLKKDGSAWTDSGKTITLQQASETRTATMEASGVFTANVVNGTWKVLVDGAATGATVVINNAAASQNLNYYTVNFAVADAGAASGSTIAATYNSAAISAGDVVLGGKQLVITAAGAGAGSYMYAWNGAGTSGETTAVLTIANLSSSVNAICNVGGIGTAPTITTVSLQDGTVSTAYGQTLAATGTAPITWSITAGILPSGLSLNASTGEITGTPTTAGTATFTVKASNGTLPDATKALSITINPSSIAPTISTVSLQDGTVGTAYDQTLAATGTAPIIWSITAGALPAGLNLNASTGEITGTPTTTGTATLTVKASNGTLPDATQILSITINPSGTAPIITTASLQDGTVGTAYDQTLAATGTAPITWSITAGALPAGLNLNASTGEITGTPTTTGTATFTIKASNGTLPDATQILSITINPSGTAPTITTVSLQDGTGGTAYDQTLAATGTAPITWSITAGALPAGLNLNASTGEITGTPTTAGSATFTIKASNGTLPDATQILSITVNPSGTAPVITTASLQDGTVGAAYDQTLAATGTAPITWSITAGSLPVGLGLNTSTGEITGTPTTTGTATFTVKASNGTLPDATQALSITINPSGTAPTITTVSLQDGTVGTAYGQTLAATGTAPITWSITAGILPSGLSLNASTGKITGTPTTAGTATFTVKASNGTLPDATQALSITINPSVIAPAITTASLPSGTVGAAYDRTLTAAGTAPITWSIATGTLPSGLSLNASTGEITGTPTTAGTCNFTVQASNSTSSDTKTYTVAITAAPATYTLTITAGSGGTVSSAGGIYAAGTPVSIAATPSSNYSFSRWMASNGGSFADASSASTIFTMPAINTAITAVFTYNGSGGGNAGGTPTATPAPTQVPIIVDNNNYYIGNIAEEDNTATITVDQSEFDKQLADAKYSVVIPVTTDAKTVVAQLVVKNVQDMNDKGVPLSVQTGNTRYNIPASSVDTKAILSALGATDPSLAPVNVIIKTDVGSATQAFVNSVVKATGAEIVVPAVQFEITASYEGKTCNIEKFDHFVSRSVEITQEQALQITTAIVIDPDGTTRHVPTFVYQKDGKWYAQINSMTNSTYALIFNQMSFSDSAGKWYQSVVDEMGSRKIISGVGNNCFAGDKAITRAEFAAIVVRALGLPVNGTATFSDVPLDSWYSGAVATAAQYGIVSGVGDNKFAPDASITREEAMQMIYNASRLTPYVAVSGADNTKNFVDYGTQSAWSTNAVNFNLNNGFIQGYSGQFNPKSNITRAETATVVLKLLQKSGLVDVRTKL